MNRVALAGLVATRLRDKVFERPDPPALKPPAFAWRRVRV